MYADPPKLRITFRPESQRLVFSSPLPGVSRIIRLNRDETAAIAEAGSPFVIPRITTLVATLRKLSGAALSKHMTAAANRTAYAAQRPNSHLVHRQHTEIVDTPTGPVKVRTMVRTNPRTGYSVTTIDRSDPHANTITHTVVRHRPPAAPVTTHHETFPALYRIKPIRHSKPPKHTTTS